MSGLSPLPRREARRALGLDPVGLYIGAFGIIAPQKRLAEALRAFAHLRPSFPEARFLCVGAEVAGSDLRAVAEELGVGDVVEITGHVPQPVMARYLWAVDVGVNLRTPTWGETSGALLRLMSCGVPTLVTDAGAFAELPDDVVVKVAAGPEEVEAVEAALQTLLSDEGQRAAIGRAAQAFVSAHCSPPQVARQIAEFIYGSVGEVCTSFT